MKTIVLLAALLALSLNTGCVTAKLGSEYGAFIAKLPAAKITDVATQTQSPFYNFNASASGISTDPETGVMTIVNGKAGFAIPLWGFSKTFTVSGLQFQASPEQIAAAAALKKAADTAKPATP